MRRLADKEGKTKKISLKFMNYEYKSGVKINKP